ncbi:MAG: hypothetical protein BA864_13810 [Desulfuromonadales bacterium C00003093]|nr:MAG: hypothetical protein BA864_13810 [Desulfuromonadales bacterium C00003093]
MLRPDSGYVICQEGAASSAPTHSVGDQDLGEYKIRPYMHINNHRHNNAGNPAGIDSTPRRKTEIRLSAALR